MENTESRNEKILRFLQIIGKDIYIFLLKLHLQKYTLEAKILPALFVMFSIAYWGYGLSAYIN